MTGCLGMPRACNSLVRPIATITTVRDAMRFFQMPLSNFINDTLFEMIDSTGQAHRQLSVLYAITNVFLAISIIVEKMKRVIIGTYGHHKLQQPSCWFYKYCQD